MSITTAQIRGARGILGWSQQDLAEQTGISATSIGSIENGQSTPREKTLKTIRKAFENSGIEFIGLDGIRLQTSDVRIYRGQQGSVEFYDDIYETLHKTPGEVSVSNVDERKFYKFAGNYFETHEARMKEIEGISYKILIREGDDFFLASEYAEYRWLPKEQFGTVPFYLYGKKLAILLFGEEPVVIVLDYPEVAEAYKVQFNAFWDIASLPKTRANN